MKLKYIKYIKFHFNWYSVKRYILFPMFQFITIRLNPAYCGKYKHNLEDDGDRLQLVCTTCGYRANVSLISTVDDIIKNMDKYLNGDFN